MAVKRAGRDELGCRAVCHRLGATVLTDQANCTRRASHDGDVSQIKRDARAGMWVGTISLPTGTRQYVHCTTQDELAS